MTLGVVYMLGIDHPWGVFWPTVAGLLAGIVIGFTSDYFTDIDQKAVQQTANSANTGAAILILDGFSYGLLSIVPSIIGICVAMVAAWFLAVQFGRRGHLRCLRGGRRHVGHHRHDRVFGRLRPHRGQCQGLC